MEGVARVFVICRGCGKRRSELGVAERGQRAKDCGEDEGEPYCRARLGGGSADEDVDAGADDDADAARSDFDQPEATPHHLRLCVRICATPTSFDRSRPSHVQEDVHSALGSHQRDGQADEDIRPGAVE